MSVLQRFKAYMLGQDDNHISADADELRGISVPVSDGDCRYCADPCDQGHEEYPVRFDADMETQMYGSVKPYRRQVIISTGKSDWVQEVTSESGSLASYLDLASGSIFKVKEDKGGKEGKGDDKKSKEKQQQYGAPFNSQSQTRISILNGSHHTVCDDNKRETVLIFPDYKVITEVERSREGAERLWKVAVSPSVGRAGIAVVDDEDTSDSPIRSWVLPYSCVILLCSHKRRDNRCGLAGPKLEAGFTTALEREGWQVHRQLETPEYYGIPLEELTGTPEEREAEIVRQLKNLDPDSVDTKKALIIRNSHIGGHKFAGNCIIYTPQGAGVWYGRVTPHNVDPIVKETIIDGKILPSLLRGGTNISQPGHENIHQW